MSELRIGGIDFDFPTKDALDGKVELDALEGLRFLAKLLPNAESATIILYPLKTKDAWRCRIKVLYLDKAE